jgi:hypothetical protein
MFYAPCDNIGSMYKLAVTAIDDVNSACAEGVTCVDTFKIEKHMV